MSFDGSRAQYYRDRATEVRSVAESCRDACIKSQLEHVAEQYDALAQSVDAGFLSR